MSYSRGMDFCEIRHTTRKVSPGHVFNVGADIPPVNQSALKVPHDGADRRSPDQIEAGCCMRDGGRPSRNGLQDQFSNRPSLRGDEIPGSEQIGGKAGLEGPDATGGRLAEGNRHGEGQLDQVERLTGRVPGTTFVDKGYQGHGVDPGRSRMLLSGTCKLSYTLKRHLRRRAAIEPEIGHMKGDGLLGRNFLKDMAGDAINALLRGAGHNLRKILARLRALLCLLPGEARAALKAFLDRIGFQFLPQPVPKPA